MLNQLEILRLGRPSNIYVPVLGDTVSKVQIDKTLVRNTSLGSHALEVGDHVLRKTHGDRLLELGGVRIRPRFHFGKIVFGSHG